MLREMSTTYGRSPGGYAWAILEPVAAITVLSIVFSMAFHAPVLGSNFPLFYATAYLPFMMFMDVTMKVATSIRFSKSLLSYPIVSIFDVIFSRLILNLLTHILVFIIVVVGISMIFDLSIEYQMLKLISAVLMTAALALGFGTLTCYLFTRFPVTERLWQVATRPLIIVSGLFFLFESVPANFKDIIWFNPLFHITGQMRASIYSSYEPQYVSTYYVFLLGLSLFVLGFLLLFRTSRDLLERI